MNANSSKQPSYRIEDSQGTVIEAQGMFKNVKAAASNAQAKADSRGSSPSSTSQASDTKDCYICWFGDFATYGGATREEAISGGRTSKRMNPDTHIRVTEHRARGTMTINEISQTPGKTILDLP